MSSKTLSEGAALDEFEAIFDAERERLAVQWKKLFLKGYKHGYKNRLDQLQSNQSYAVGVQWLNKWIEHAKESLNPHFPLSHKHEEVGRAIGAFLGFVDSYCCDMNQFHHAKGNSKNQVHDSAKDLLEIIHAMGGNVTTKYLKKRIQKIARKNPGLPPVQIEYILTLAKIFR